MYKNHWNEIRSLYEKQTPLILSRPRDVFWVDPYAFDWLEIFTPIESSAWQSIRGLGIPLYPQYPIDSIFVDFGDPVKKIALECDGKDFHNKQDDTIRDNFLNSIGWTVFRVTGSECYKPGLNLEPLLIDLHNEAIRQIDFDAKIEDWAMNSSDGVISAIAWNYYNKARSEHIEKHLLASLQSHSRHFLRGEK